MTENFHSAYRYDVAISYSTADAPLVSEIAEYLRDHQLRVFFGGFEETLQRLWGKNLTVELQDIYRRQSATCIVFIPRAYAQSVWARHELQAALGASLDSDDYLKPIRLDDTELRGFPPEVSYLDARPGAPFADPARSTPARR